MTLELRNGDSSDVTRSVSVAPGDNWLIDLRLEDGEVSVVDVQRRQQDVTPELVTVPDKAIEKAKSNQSLTVQPTATSTSTSTPTPTQTATPPPTATPRPTATPTPRPLATPSKEIEPALQDATDAETLSPTAR
jgi:hypothetical protein